PLGVPLSFGGPWAGLMATRAELVRQLPGRIVGQTVDHDGRRGFVLTLQAREQHIRREKATSNICTSQTLLALGATILLSLGGPAGLRAAASRSHQRTVELGERLTSVDGFRVVTQGPIFNELVLECPVSAAEVRATLLDRGIVAGADVSRDFPELSRC